MANGAQGAITCSFDGDRPTAGPESHYHEANPDLTSKHDVPFVLPPDDDAGDVPVQVTTRYVLGSQPGGNPRPD
jgi:hypothetical protein